MISKSNNLVAVFTILFLLLLGIQAYFLVKTYQLKENEINRNIHTGLSDITEQLEDLGGIKKFSSDSLQSIFIQYNNQEITKQEFLDFFEINRKNNQKKFSQYIDQEFKNQGYKVAAKIEYISIVFVPKNYSLIDKPIVLYETENRVSNPKILNTGTWETSSTSPSKDEDRITKSNTFIVKSKTSYEILNIKSVLFKELVVLMISCFALLTAVLLLYIFTIKNLLKQQKLVETLYSVVDNISHEFKTPIATLKIASKTLKKDWNPKTLPLIDRQITRLESLMFQLYKDDNEGEVIKIKPEDWGFIIQDLVFIYPDVQFILKNNTSQELPFNRNLMETVLKNLCENSVKYGASIVKINIIQSIFTLDIEVSDNGKGIEKKEFKNIFEKFYRIQSDNIHDTKGLGLGLYFVQKIIKKYNGTITVSSQPKEGTTFKIKLPYEN